MRFFEERTSVGLWTLFITLLFGLAASPMASFAEGGCLSQLPPAGPVIPLESGLYIRPGSDDMQIQLQSDKTISAKRKGAGIEIDESYKAMAGHPNAYSEDFFGKKVYLFVRAGDTIDLCGDENGTATLYRFTRQGDGLDHRLDGILSLDRIMLADGSIDNGPDLTLRRFDNGQYFMEMPSSQGWENHGTYLLDGDKVTIIFNKGDAGKAQWWEIVGSDCNTVSLREADTGNTWIFRKITPQEADAIRNSPLWKSGGVTPN